VNKADEKQKEENAIFNHRDSTISKDAIDFKGASLTEKECCICFDYNPDCVIMECGHGGICYECGK